jgi:hypothetical protein
MRKAIKSSGICHAHGHIMDFPVRIVHTMLLTSDKNLEPYYNLDRNV